MHNLRYSRHLSLCLLLSSCICAAEFVWVEGEDATSHTMNNHSWYNSVNRDALSGGDWLCHFGGGSPPEAQYRFSAPQADSYTFWIRANSVAGPRLSYRLERKAWTEVDLSNAIENLNIAADGKPDMRFVSWINIGSIHLKQGQQTITFKFHSGNNNHGGIDCFVFSLAPFFPRGALKPGAKTGFANPGYFAWEPNIDSFTDDALLDLRSLNEAQAGQNGRIQAQGDHFRLADDTPVKFWAVNAGPGIWRLDDASHIYLAKTLAKRGVNMIRLHGSFFNRNTGVVKEENLRRLQHLIWAMKQEGIYSHVSFYFPAWFRLDDWHREKDTWPFMLLFFDEDMQAVYFQWAQALLTTPNPYTGLPLGKDPAVAILEIQNEDSHFFWTFKKTNCPPERWGTLKSLYGQWLIEKYGSIGKAIEAWDGHSQAGDNTRSARMELLNAWHMTNGGLKSNSVPHQRVLDQTGFLTDNMRGFYQMAIDRFRRDYGYEGLVSCGNWHTADAQTLDALERYCYTAGDIIDRHGYFDPNHSGEGARYSIRTGQTFTSESALHLRRNSPVPLVETEGYPSIISEIGWPMPNMYRAEGSFLCAAYGALLGLDGIFHFSVGSSSWDQGVGKFILNNPVALGSYYANALLYRLQYVKEAPPVVRESLVVNDLLALKGSTTYVRPALDQFRADQIPDGAGSAPLGDSIDPLSFYVGRVLRNYDGQPAQSMTLDLSPFIDRQAKTVTSFTQELQWDYGQGVVTINAQKAQGAAGSLGHHGPINLDTVTLTMQNDYGTVLVVALDNKPLSHSQRVLIQCTTIDQPYGWATSEPQGLAGTIEQVGGAPWGMQKYNLSLSLKWPGTDPITVTACDENGYRSGKTVSHERRAGTVTLHIHESTSYTIVSRGAL